MFMFILLFSSTMAITSSSWIMVWFWMELNMFSFITLMSNSKAMSQDSMMIYFLVQTSSSLFFLISMLSMDSNGPMNINMTSLSLTLALLVKMGAAPFHQWTLLIAHKIPMPTIGLMLTIQKIIPIGVFPAQNMMKPLLLSSILGSMFTMFLSNKLSSSKSIMAISSINNMGWMTLSICASMSITAAYFLVYTSTTLIAINLLTSMNTSSIILSQGNMIPMSINILSMIGIPPLLGFFPKLWIMSISASLMNLTIIPSLLIMSSCFMAMMYFMLIIPSFLNKSNKKPIKSMQLLPLMNLLPLPLILFMN